MPKLIVSRTPFGSKHRRITSILFHFTDCPTVALHIKIDRLAAKRHTSGNGGGITFQVLTGSYLASVGGTAAFPLCGIQLGL